MSQYVTYSDRPIATRPKNSYASEVDKITENIFLGDANSATGNKLFFLQQNQIKGIVNCIPNSLCAHKESIAYFLVNINDNEGADITPHLSPAVSFMHEIIIKGGSVLVHCQQGISRSSSIVIAYLIHHHSHSRDTAYSLVKALRPQIDPNSSFWNQLLNYEKTHHLIEEEPTDYQDYLCIKNPKKWAKYSRAKGLHQDFSSLTKVFFPTTEVPLTSLPSLETRLKHIKLLSLQCLDIVLGDGILASDVEWIRLLVQGNCQRPDDKIRIEGSLKKNSDEDLIGENINGNSLTLQATMREACFEFFENEFDELWRGEFRPKELNYLKNSLFNP